MDKKFDPLTMEGEEAMKVVRVCVECERGIRDKRVCVLKCSDCPLKVSTFAG